MNNRDKEQLYRLSARLEELSQKQKNFAREIYGLRQAIQMLKKSGQVAESPPEDEVHNLQAPEAQDFEPAAAPSTAPKQINTPKKPKRVKSKPLISNSDLEKFIGENLINKIGIAITVIGVGIGVKYSIDNDLISPLVRLILGYLVGTVLLGFGMRLKKGYKNFSAVLVSGATAIMYFMTYAAYDFYGMLPQSIAFALMVVFTVFTVVAALHYDLQVIAHIALVGAYAVPFLLSNDTGNVTVLFSYISIINIGILFIAFRKYWNSLYYASFGLTWLIYFVWFVGAYAYDKHFTVGLVFLSVFFAIFYATFLAYSLRKEEKFNYIDIILLLSNAFIFYGLGYAILNDHPTGEELLGLFTLGNGIIHFFMAFIIFKQKKAGRNLFYLLSGLVLVFIAITFPVQLDGNWVTLLWTGEAALLFWIGRTKKISFYERFSYPLMVLAFGSLLQDWNSYEYLYDVSNPENRLFPLFNIRFLTSTLFIAAGAFIYFINRNKKYWGNPKDEIGKFNLFTYLTSGVLLFTIYMTFRLEITTYWNQLFSDSYIELKDESGGYLSHTYNWDLQHFKEVWVLNYSLLFFTLLAFFNIKKLKHATLGLLNLGFTVIVLFFFLGYGLYELSELRESYLDESPSEYYRISIFNVIIRYLALACAGITLAICYRLVRQGFMNPKWSIPFDFILHLAIVWMASSELIHWMDMSGAKESQMYKLGLSILWGIYSLFLIAVGIWKKKQHLRIGAIVLFAITLVKLFFYDIENLDTIAKTIVFVSLGALLLIISFLYNKYKHIISNEGEN